MNAASRRTRMVCVLGVLCAVGLAASSPAQEVAPPPAPQSAPQPVAKPKVCVMKFEAEGNVSPHLGNFLYNTLIERFVAADAFVVVDWEQINRLLKFIQQSQPNLSAEDARRQAVNQAGVDKLYFGTLSKVGRKYHLLVKVLNFDLTVERTERQVVWTEDELEQAVTQLADRLVLPHARIAWQSGTYDGCVLNGKPHGEGTLYYGGRDGLDRYQGRWSDGRRHGTGTLYYAPGNPDNLVKYDGQWQLDQATGRGTLCWQDGGKYVGQIKDGLPCGQGVLYHLDGAREEGAWKAGKLDGRATIYTSEDEKAVGQCVSGKRQGAWTFYNRSTVLGTKVYEADRLARETLAAR